MSAEKRVTINEIARLAQVSKGTVSKVLNNKPGIGEETRKRIMELVNHLDYHPSFVAQSLANQKTNNIGLIIPHEAGQSLNGSYWSALITSIAQEAANKNYNLMLFTPKVEGELAETYQSVLRSHRVDGLIIGSELIDKQSMSQLYVAGIPFILIGRNPEFQHYYVDIDNRFAARSMIDHMLHHGYRKIGFISGPLKYYYNKERFQAYNNVLQEHNLMPRTSEAKNYTTESTYQAVDYLLNNHGDLDALFIGVGGEFLYDILGRLSMRKVDIHNLGVAVFDDYRYLDFIEPRLTAVKQPLEAMGTQVTRGLLKLIDGKEMDELNLVLPTTITVRGSCGDNVPNPGDKNSSNR